MFVAAGFAAANGDLPIARDSQDRKSAYAAAESGVNFYQFHLNADNNYWLKCANVPAPNATEKNPVNTVWNGSGADPRRWRNVSGSAAQYTIELLPAKGTNCVENDQNSHDRPEDGDVPDQGHRPAERRLEAAADDHRDVPAQVVPGLPLLHRLRDAGSRGAYRSTSDTTWAKANCAKKYRAFRHKDCTLIQFPSIDFLKGPMHTNEDDHHLRAPDVRADRRPRQARGLESGEARVGRPTRATATATTPTRSSTAASPTAPTR